VVWDKGDRPLVVGRKAMEKKKRRNLFLDLIRTNCEHGRQPFLTETAIEHVRIRLKTRLAKHAALVRRSFDGEPLS